MRDFLSRTRSVAQDADDDLRWAAVVRRDKDADGTFYYSVQTTGVYCRPCCGARLPLRENVIFHATRADAERAGFRPCKRCKPDQPTLRERHTAIMVAACRQIQNADTPPSLAALAAAAHMSPHHFHRLFREIAGVTPADYAEAHRAQRVRNALETSGSVTAGDLRGRLQLEWPLYENTNRSLGMTPSDYRAGGANTGIRFALGQCSLGAVLVASTDKGVCAISLGDEPEPLLRELQDRFPAARLIGGDRAFEDLVARVVGMIEAPAQPPSLPLDVRGTAFQRRVWQALCEIPPGATASYAQIAGRIGAPGAVRAVAQACAANTLAVAIPCHRVVRQDGALSGYRWGVERKRTLIEREAGK